MKKVLSLILAVAMIAAFLCTPAFAAGSKEALVEIKSEKVVVAESAAPEVTVEEVAEAVAALDEEGLKAFEEAGLDVAEVTVAVLDQKDIEVEAGMKATLTVEMEGVEDATIAVFLKLSDGTMKLLKVGVPPLEVETEESGTLVIALVK